MTEQEQRLVRYDNELKVEAHQFNGIMQKFPNHFHEYYVIGFVASGKRHLTCKNKDYTIPQPLAAIKLKNRNHPFRQCVCYNAHIRYLSTTQSETKSPC